MENQLIYKSIGLYGSNLAVTLSDDVSVHMFVSIKGVQLRFPSSEVLYNPELTLDLTDQKIPAYAFKEFIHKGDMHFKDEVFDLISEDSVHLSEYIVGQLVTNRAWVKALPFGLDFIKRATLVNILGNKDILTDIFSKGLDLEYKQCGIINRHITSPTAFRNVGFRKYQHVDRFGKRSVRDINAVGTCYTFPKIDGTNASIWMDDDFKIHCGSRNQEIGYGADNRGFGPKHIDPIMKAVFLQFPNHTVFGEWLVPHSLRTYDETAWKKFYIFDLMDEQGNYIPYEFWAEKLDKLGLNVLKPLSVDVKPSEEFLQNIATNENKVLIGEGLGVGEGIVVKNYNRVNYPSQIWAKILAPTYKNKGNAKGAHKVNNPGKETNHVNDFLRKFFDETFIAKEVTKIIYDAKLPEGEEFHISLMPKVMSIPLETCIQEELWDFLLKRKMPTINFSSLKKQADKAVINYLKTNHLL